MKLKRFVGILAAIAIIASSSTGFAATWRHSRKGQAKFPDRGGKNDYFYEDFSGTEPGTLPAGVSGGSNANGYFTTEVTDIGGGVMKNCFKLVDESHETGVGSTPSSVINLANYKGMVELLEKSYFDSDKFVVRLEAVRLLALNYPTSAATINVL